MYIYSIERDIDSYWMKKTTQLSSGCDLQISQPARDDHAQSIHGMLRENSLEIDGIYPLVNKQKTIEHGDRNS